MPTTSTSFRIPARRRSYGSGKLFQSATSLTISATPDGVLVISHCWIAKANDLDYGLASRQPKAGRYASGSKTERSPSFRRRKVTHRFFAEISNGQAAGAVQLKRLTLWELCSRNHSCSAWSASSL